MSLTQQRLKELLHYCPHIGIFWWNEREDDRAFNVNHAGNIAGHLSDKRYARISIGGKHYKAHRLAWFYMTGEWPKDQIDHRNGWKLDNAFDNLREATNSQNAANRPRSRPHLPKGVSAKGNRWRARITYGKRKHDLGTFDTPDEAHEAYAKRAREVHGEFARPS